MIQTTGLGALSWYDVAQDSMICAKLSCLEELLETLLWLLALTIWGLKT